MLGGKKKPKNPQPPKNKIGLHIPNGMRKQQEEGQIMALVKKSGPRALSHHHKRGAHLKKGCNPTG